MEDLSILWVAAVLIAVVGLAGCASPSTHPDSMARLPPVPSASDTNRLSSGASIGDASEMSVHSTDNQSLRGSRVAGPGTTLK